MQTTNSLVHSCNITTDNRLIHRGKISWVLTVLINLDKQALEMEVVLANTTPSGSLFQQLTTWRWNKLASTILMVWHTDNFLVLPLVWVLGEKEKKLLESMSILLFHILWHVVKLLIILRVSNVCKPRADNLTTQYELWRVASRLYHLQSGPEQQNLQPAQNWFPSSTYNHPLNTLADVRSRGTSKTTALVLFADPQSD